MEKEVFAGDIAGLKEQTEKSKQENEMSIKMKEGLQQHIVSS